MQHNLKIKMVESVETDEEKLKKKPKRGIIYLSTIPPYMNVTKIREKFGEYGNVGRVYLQLNTDKQNKKSKKNVAEKFTEGWVEFERKSTAKKVAELLNNRQVSTRKKSKQYDCIWNIKYLSNFKWTHLHERLEYEKAAKRQKLRAEIQSTKKKANYFSANIRNKNKTTNNVNEDNKEVNLEEAKTDQGELFSSLFS